jgi:hypothetical protein
MLDGPGRFAHATGERKIGASFLAAVAAPWLNAARDTALLVPVR